MSDELAYIGLGSNFPDKERRIEAAIDEIGRLPGIEFVAGSSLYLTEPQDYRNQPWFANAVVAVRPADSWTPESLLDALLEIEKRGGRTRENVPRGGPRAIDVDLLVFGEIETARRECLVPHPRALTRAFVLVPLLELNPGLKIGGRSPLDALFALVWRREGNRLYQDGVRYKICPRGAGRLPTGTGAPGRDQTR
ncbi:MAG: 2-amino-4-hydroxy-6-hydroxymethyldihydropteridine diphosphokinase [Desulfovibrio sp.]|nr:2-amino-4-hydroxy-6-hydroxymethyldihydropteridine diphosphokinase [Desulfovibrio sp.]